MFNSVTDFQFDVAEDLAKAVVASLKHSVLFEDVFFTYGGEKKDADLIISGEVLSTDYIGKTYSYGLSVEGPLLWLLGFPCGSSYNKLNLKLYLNKPGSRDPLWQYEFLKEKTVVQGLYYKIGYDVKGYATLMEDGMNDAIRDLDSKLGIILKDPENKSR